MTSAELQEALPAPEFVEAAEILNMIKQTPEELHKYRARMKLLIDEAARQREIRESEARIASALQQGEETGLVKGRQEGELLGRIKVLQELLGLETPTAETLAKYDLARLTALAQRLQKKIPRIG